MLWLFFGSLGCAGCAGSEEPRPAKGVNTTAAGDGLVGWPPVPSTLLASDAGLLAGELAKVKAAAASRPVPSSAGGRAPDIVVIVLDTVRADHLGVYGYDRDTTPNLDAWAQAARVYENAWTDSPWTLPAHASMFTGKPEREHAARALPLTDVRKGAPLAESFSTVAERLQAAGWRTVAVTGNRAFLHPSFGLSQGFDAWVNEAPERDTRGVGYTPADRIRPMAEAVLAQADEHPLFLFVNFMDAHTPYVPRRGFVRSPELLRPASLPGNGGGFRRASAKLLQGGRLDPDVQASWSEAYDAELRFLDLELGLLLQQVKAPHVYILADHGEYLGEHSLVEHAKDVYEPVLHVPFLARAPDLAPGRDASLVQTHDLAWMVLSAAGLPHDDIERPDDLAVSELTLTLKKDLGARAYGARFNRTRRAFRVGAHKLILGTDGSRESFDLAADPAETHPFAALPPIFDGLAAAWLAAHPEQPVVGLGEGSGVGPDEEALRALGYVE